MGLLDFLGPLKPLVLVVVWVSIGISWFLAIAITFLVPFSFFLTVPAMIILGVVSIFAIGGLYIVGKKSPENCQLIDGDLVCDI